MELNTLRRYLYKLFLVGVLFVICSTPARSQFTATELIEDDQSVSLTFHKVVNGTAGPALDLTNPSLKFYTGDLVRVVYKAPFDSYVYIVNASTSGGTTLQYPRRPEQNEKIAANQSKNFSFKLTNPEAVSGLVNEELVLVISRVKVDNPMLNDLLKNYSELDDLKKRIARAGSATAEQKGKLKELETATKLPDPPREFRSQSNSTTIQKAQGSSKATKAAKVIGRIACNVASGWLGGLFRVACGTGIFGATEFEEDDSNVVQASPQGNTERS